MAARHGPQLKVGMGPGDRADGQHRKAYDVRIEPDGWTVKTIDGSPSSHFEHTIAITDGGPMILTALADGTARF
jgi:methionyl aminopeptidase